MYLDLRENKIQRSVNLVILWVWLVGVFFTVYIPVEVTKLASLERLALSNNDLPGYIQYTYM